MKRKTSLLIGCSAIAGIVIGGTGYWMRQVKSPQAAVSPHSTIPQATTSNQRCLTFVSDTDPPLNVRSSPTLAPNNVVSRLNNGTRLVAIATVGEWLQIQAPLEGWVAKSRTYTHCVPAAPASSSQADSSILTAAIEQYQAGNLEVAIALAQSIANVSSNYETAQTAIAKWQQDWQLAATQFDAAQAALHKGQWQEVLNQVNGFPDNRFWRGKLTPVVKAAIEKQGLAASNYEQKTERITLPPDNRPATIAGRFTGSGLHRYLLSGVQGQTLTLETGGLGPLPTITAPNGSPLKNGQSADKTRWSGKLPFSGDYTLKLQSEAQPYDYAFSVQLD